MNLSRTIHIVDDDDAVRNSLRYALKAAGFHVASYASASDFLADVSAVRGVVISDVRMAGMNGIELLTLLKQRGSMMPVILITGNADANLSAEATAAGAVALLEKPVALATILAAIGRVIEN